MRKRKPKPAAAEKRAATTPGMVEIFNWPDGGGPRFETPCLGTIRNCEPTDFGWRGIMPDGRVAEFRSQSPGERAMMPDHHILSRRDDGEVIGAYLIERADRSREPC